MIEVLTDIGQVAAWLGGGLAGLVFAADRTFGVAMRLGRGPKWYKTIRSQKAHEIVDNERRQEQLAILASLTPQLKLVAGGYEDIRKAVMPNGGSSISDKVNQVAAQVMVIERKLDEHIAASDKVEAEVYSDLAEMGRDVDVLKQRVK